MVAGSVVGQGSCSGHVGGSGHVVGAGHGGAVVTTSVVGHGS